MTYIRCIVLTSIILLQIFFSAPASATDNNSFHVQLSSEKISRGDVALVSIQKAGKIQSAKYVWGDIAAEFYYDREKNRFSAFLPVDLAMLPGEKVLKITATNADGCKTTKDILFEVTDKTFPLQKLTLPEGQVTLSKKDLKRHRREKAVVKKVFSHAVPDKIWNTKFIRPHRGKLSTPFGVRRLINNKPKNPHSGIDLKASQGDPVVSSGDGVVVCVGNHFFSGNSVFIDHGTGIVSMYFHLSAFNVKAGDKVSRGEIIGAIGSTGRSTGPHLHWGVKINKQRIDPLSLLQLFDNHGENVSH
jgi:murein DD-endopeptidase MepM/ murein hydrolase activator NlpD